MGVMGRFVGGGGWQGKRVDWVPLFQCFFFPFFVSLIWLHAYIIYQLFTHSYVTVALQASLLFLFLTTFHIPHPFTGFAASTYLSRIILCSTIHNQYLLAPFFRLLFPHIIDTYHIVTTAMNSVCIFSSAFHFRFWVSF